MKTKILNFGSCNIDYVYEIAHIVIPGETIPSNSFSKFPGGKGLNQSIAVARSGLPIYHAGCIGSDGTFLKELLENSNVNTQYLKVENSSTGHAIIQVDANGENCIILHHGANYEIEKDYIDSVLNDFSADDILILQNEISNLEYIISKGYERKMKIILNPSPFVKSLQEIDLNKISTLILNQIEAYEFTGEREPEKVGKYFINKYSNLEVVLTLGSKGSTYFSKNYCEFCPSCKVKVKDTTAAGDTFTGYFISGMLQDMGVKNSLKYATVAAALAISKIGAASSIPINKDVEDAL